MYMCVSSFVSVGVCLSVYLIRGSAYLVPLCQSVYACVFVCIHVHSVCAQYVCVKVCVLVCVCVRVCACVSVYERERGVSPLLFWPITIDSHTHPSHYSH